MKLEPRTVIKLSVLLMVVGGIVAAAFCSFPCSPPTIPLGDVHMGQSMQTGVYGESTLGQRHAKPKDI